jgi:hypothetical protein
MRVSSRGRPAGDDQTRAAAKIPEILGFSASDAQLRAKATFWVKHREDPLVSPDRLTTAEVARMSGAPQLTKWWTQEDFRGWFLSQDTWRAELAYAFEMWVSQAAARMSQTDLMPTKEFIGLGKLLAELAGRMPRTGPTSETPLKQLTEGEARQQFDAAAKALGYLPPKTEGAR